MWTIQKAAYIGDLKKAETLRPPQPPPWTEDELVARLAVDLERVAPPKELSAIEGRNKVELTPSTVCHGCGAVGKHLSRNCPQTCRFCNFNFCPGARHMACAVCFDVRPTERTPPIENGLNRRLNDTLLKKLDAAWQLKHPGSE